MTANKNYPIGVKDFKRIVQENYVFIDKTLFIKDIMENKSGVILITRPRRFGKTMGMSMLEHFLKISGDASIFKGLKIEQHPEFCIKHQNKYPVIFLSFKDIKALNFKDCFTGFKEVFKNLYGDHLDLLDGDVLRPGEKDRFNQILEGKIEDPTELSFALRT